MANIPVERSAGTPWWLWLLGLLLLGGLIWFIAEAFDDDDDYAATDDTIGVVDDGVVDDGVVDPGMDDVDGGVVTTADDLYADDDGLFGADAGMDDDATGGDIGSTATAVVTRIEPGTRVDVQDARVLRVVGDSTFWIGTDELRKTLVVLSSLGESETGAGGTDGVFNIDAGDTVSITGAFARYADGDRGLSELVDDDSQALRNRQVYIRVDSRDDLTVVE